MKISGILLIINAVLLLFLWIFTGLHYAELPEIIPTHFAFDGTIDGESPKKIIWFLPSLATFVFLILASVSRNPQSPMLNVPNSFRDKEKLKLFSFTILIPVLLLFGDIVVETVLIGQGKLHKLSHCIIVLLCLVLLTVGAWLYIMIKERQSVKS